MHLMSKKPKDFVLISGDDLLTVSLYALGAVGVISVLANAFGDHFKTIKEKKQTNDYLGASEELFKLLRINELMFKESNPVGIKYVLKAQGVCNAYVRLPLLEASPSLKTAIETEMKSIY